MIDAKCWKINKFKKADWLKEREQNFGIGDEKTNKNRTAAKTLHAYTTRREKKVHTHTNTHAPLQDMASERERQTELDKVKRERKRTHTAAYRLSACTQCIRKYWCCCWFLSVGFSRSSVCVRCYHTHITLSPRIGVRVLGLLFDFYVNKG